MAGVTPNEGEHLILNLIYKNADVDRGSSLELGLFTNSSGLGETSVLGDITEPTGGGYARKTLADASWNIVVDDAAYAIQTFLASGGDYSAQPYGYFIATTGTQARLLHFEVDLNAPIRMNNGDSYAVDLSNLLD